jgi:serine/threonine protein kinase
VRWLSNETIAHLRELAEWPDLGETKYVLREELGRGGMGTVYLAEDTVLGRTVALKVVAAGETSADAARRMLREARIVARLEHPGIVPIHDVGSLPDGRVFYAMKCVAGGRLDAIAAGMSLPERLRVFQRICEAVAFAHAHGVIHRDLKPQNVMVGRFGEVLVMDWGVAKVVGDGAAAGVAVAALPGTAGAPDDTAQGTLVGTLAYMAPEQAEGRLDAVDARSDVYALGAILYFLLTGRPPFVGEAAVERAKGASRAAPVPPHHWVSEVPRPLEAIVAKAMAVAPERRYPAAEALIAEIARFLDRERVLAHHEGLLDRAARFFDRYRTPIFLILAYLLMRTTFILWARR